MVDLEFIGDPAEVKRLAINDSLAADSDEMKGYLKSGRAEVFMKFSKKDWIEGDEAYLLVKSAIEHFAASELCKNKPMKAQHAEFLVTEAMRKLKMIAQNPGFSSAGTKPFTMFSIPRTWKTRGMDATLAWYKSLKVNNDGNNANGYLASPE